MCRVLFCQRTKRPTFGSKSSKTPGVASSSQRITRSQLSAVCARSGARARHTGSCSRILLWMPADTPDPTLIERSYRRSERLRRIIHMGFGAICRFRRGDSHCVLVERARASLRAQLAKRQGLAARREPKPTPSFSPPFTRKGGCLVLQEKNKGNWCL